MSSANEPDDTGFYEQPTHHPPLNFVPHPDDMPHIQQHFAAQPDYDYNFAPANQHELMEWNTAAAQPQRNQTNSHGQPAYYPPAYDPQALLNPRAPPKRPASDTDADRPGNHAGDSASTGQMNLVERLHGVQHRTASPAKRAKTEDDAMRMAQSRPGIPGGSMVAAQLQNATLGAPAASPSKPVAIDLTMSDDEKDDEIKVVKDNSAQVICIGKVHHAYVQTHLVPSPDPSKYSGNRGSQARIKIFFRRAGTQQNTNVIMVADPTGKEFGRVDPKTAQGLVPLMDTAKTYGVFWLAATDARRKQPGEGPPGSPTSAIMAMTVQIYCPRKMAQSIGRFLNSRHIKLVDPMIEKEKYDYFNPQNANGWTKAQALAPEFAATYGAQSGSGSVSYVVRSAEEITSDVMSMFDSLEDQAAIPTRKQSRCISTPLLKHQEQALWFMVDKEREWTDDMETRKDTLYKHHTDARGRRYWVHVITGHKVDRPHTVRGGILADEMGLGKTLSILSLIMDDESVAAAHAFAQKAPPLVNNQRRQVVNGRATLLVCPLSTMVNWRTQIEAHFPDDRQPRWIYYHGAERKQYTARELANYDLVITTYHTVAAEMGDLKMAINQINWFRIVLDEAHQIRAGTSKQARAICDLASQRKWAVTGTPVQNRLEDMYALLKFLRMKPFSDSAEFTKQILKPFKYAEEEVIPKLQLLVRSITLRRLKSGNIALPPREDLIVRLKFSENEERLYRFFEQDSARQVNSITAGGQLGGTAYARILKAILYLRLICAHGRDLLSDEALKLTEGMTNENPMDLTDDNDQAPTLNRKNAFEMLDILRQSDTDICQYTDCKQGHRQSIWKPEMNGNDTDDDDDDDESEDQPTPKTGDVRGYMTQCYHIICPRDIKRLKAEWDAQQETSGKGMVKCQFCDQRIRPDTFPLSYEDYKEFCNELERGKKDPKLAKRLGAYTGPHTKTKALLEQLRKNQAESEANPDEPPIKSVVFSSWTNHLDLIGIALDNEGFRYTRLDGRMNHKGREKALKTFAEDPSIPIILVSIGAGGLGLNLTNANKVYVMEPQFNPAAEAQAVDRVHRMGQRRPVTIMRFIMDNSFEEKMLELQRKKKDLADLTMAREKRSKDEQHRKKLEDLRSLFR